MGAIYRNGVRYGGQEVTTAANISYTNTSSGLASTNVQYAIDEVASREVYSATEPSGQGVNDHWLQPYTIS